MRARDIKVHIGDEVTTIIQPAEPAFQPLHQLPSPPRDFTGRQAELDDLLAQAEKGATISGLHGMGGVGKTALALVLADRLTDRYPDAQFYLDLKGAHEQYGMSRQSRHRIGWTLCFATA